MTKRTKPALAALDISPAVINPLLADHWCIDYRLSAPDAPIFERKGVDVIYQKLADVTGFVGTVLAADQIGEHRIALALIMETVTGALLYLEETERKGSEA